MQLPQVLRISLPKDFLQLFFVSQLDSPSSDFPIQFILNVSVSLSLLVRSALFLIISATKQFGCFQSQTSSQICNTHLLHKFVGLIRCFSHVALVLLDTNLFQSSVIYYRLSVKSQTHLVILLDLAHRSRLLSNSV